MKNNKKLLMILFGILAVLAITLPGIKNELTLKFGTPYKVKIQGYDPYDPIRGKYIQFTIDTSTISTDAVFNDFNTKVCYLSLTPDSNGYYILDKAFLNKPKDKPFYLKSFIYRSYDETYYYDSPFSSYFISEDISEKAEELLFQNIEDAYIVINFWKGNSTISGMYIGDKAIESMASSLH